jgi:CBS domain-containing protein
MICRFCISEVSDPAHSLIEDGTPYQGEEKESMKQREIGQVNERLRTESASIGQERLVNFINLQTGAVMTKKVFTISKDMTLRELDHLFEVHDFNGFPVVEDGHLIGIVSKFDCLRNFIFTTSSVFPHYEELMKRTVDQIMTKEVHTVLPTTPLTRVLQMLVNLQTKSFPVIDDESRVLGIISRGDIIRALNG